MTIETTQEQIAPSYSAAMETQMTIETTQEQIAPSYSAAMDSVNLINELKAKPTLNAEETASLSRNQEHLRVILAIDFWTTEDLKPLQNASASN